mgnify:CR=1 FL=1
MDSVFCATDNIAVGAVLYLKEAGKSVPGDIQVAGIGDTIPARIVSPALTTVHIPYKSGMEAAKMLVERMETEGAVVKELKMGYEIVMRGSLRGNGR